MKRYLNDITIGFEAILANKLKSLLTALGIIFGVAAVISMLAIGNGAQQEILQLIEMVGVNNIVITPIIEQEESSEEDKGTLQKFSKGLTLSDVDAIKEILPCIKDVSPEVSFDSYVIQNGRRKSARLVGITPSYFDMFGLELSQGTFFGERQNEYGEKVCIIGEGIKSKLFSNSNPVGKYIKSGNIWLKIVGVIKKRYYNSSGDDNIWMSNSNESIYIPVKTMILRYKNRALVTVGGNNGNNKENGENTEPVNYNQLDRVIVQVAKTEYLNPSVDLLNRMMLRRHYGVQDFEITVPELLLKQQQNTKDIFNIVLVAIASISLIVGGIGIMNIMLASVMERIREIGVRMAVGANRKDIIAQFLSESTIISLTGGIFGIFLGIGISKLITHFQNILTIVTPFSVIVAFTISVAVGIIFGIMPARRAAGRDPVESLRHE